jgi:pyruvate-ferredoxin/flavodoxin oxidoreductase
MKKLTIDGNEAVAHAAYLFTEVAGIYPITPSSPMAEHIEKWSMEGKKNIFGNTVKVVEMQSEAGAAGMVHGALQAGTLASTFTASQGLLLMIPNMYKIAGEMLPGTFHVASRSLSTHALSIFGDHQDISAVRQTGFAILSSSSVSETNHMAIISHLSSIKSSIPHLHFMDGFRTSHEIGKVDILEQKDIEDIIPYDEIKSFRDNSLRIGNPYTIGTAENGDVYFQGMESRNKYYNNLPDIINDYMIKINKVTGGNLKPYNYYGSSEATKIIVAMGSVCETIKLVVDDLNSKGEKVGLVTVHLFRPFSSKYFKEVIPNTVKSVAVLDRTKEPGSVGEPLYLDVKSILDNVTVVGGRYGLSSKDTRPCDIKAVYNMLDNPKHNFTISITDDVTNLSLDVEEYNVSKSDEIKIYGYGSDGMVSAATTLLKLLGNNTDRYVQGYFEYDSKKSGGVTVSHLRFSEDPILETYYVYNPEIVILTKDTYLQKYNVIEGIKEGGTFLINTSHTDSELLNLMPEYVQKELLAKNIEVYKVDASSISEKNNLRGIVGTLMLPLIMKLIGTSKLEDKLYDDVKESLKSKGETIVNNNINSMKEVSDSVKKVIIPGYEEEKKKTYNTLFEKMTHRLGDTVKVSEVNPRGIYDKGTTKLEKRMISNMVASWNKDYCINCNKCSTVCPHGVIRPFMLDKEEAKNVTNTMEPIEKHLSDYEFTIGVSVKDCTGCGVCVDVCPGKFNEKALSLKPLDDELHKQEEADYLFNNVKDKELLNSSMVKGLQFKEPHFEFSGACSGCGETPYLKLLTQVFNDNLIIANATGCSSIYGGSAPSMPYSVPWASSLFEDNAEYGYGILTGVNIQRDKLKKVMENINEEFAKTWLDNMDNYEITKEVYNSIDFNKYNELIPYQDYIKKPVVWTVGGDGWAYDIGYGGIDHVLSTNDDVNILVLDTEVYSNTGGQSSKSSHTGSIAAFTSGGKTNHKKDLARIALSYPHVYVAQTSLGYNMLQTIKCLEEAAKHQGPSIVICYCPCISHGIKGGMTNSSNNMNMAVTSGYFPTFRYDGNKFTLDSKNVNFDTFYDFLDSQTRYSRLKDINPNHKELYAENLRQAKERYEYYKKLSEESK